jgi:hypothetical protein
VAHAYRIVERDSKKPPEDWTRWLDVGADFLSLRDVAIAMIDAPPKADVVAVHLGPQAKCASCGAVAFGPLPGSQRALTRDEEAAGEHYQREAVEKQERKAARAKTKKKARTK